MENIILSRRSLLSHLACFGGAAAAVAMLPGCAADALAEDFGASESELRSCSSVGAVVGTNHGHVLTVSAADVTAGSAKTYTMTGGTHGHSVTVTAADFSKLKSAGQVTVTSTSDVGHSHSVTVSCTGPEAGPGPAAAKCTKGTTAAIISANHGHALTLLAADIKSGAAKSFSIRGTSAHDHTVKLAAADFAKLLTGASLTVASSTDAGHSHTVTLVCA
jgi:hypothetical protein